MRFSFKYINSNKATAELKGFELCDMANCSYLQGIKTIMVTLCTVNYVHLFQ